MLTEEDRVRLRTALEELKKGDAGAWQALAPLSSIAADGTDISIDFAAEKSIGVPLILTRQRTVKRFPAELTARQREVAEALAGGMTNKDIARELGVSPATVKDHVSAVLRAMGLSRRSQVAACVHAQDHD